MVKAAEFEEKTYEKYFGDEIKRKITDAFSPGQMAEHDLGFDESFFVPWLCRNIWFRGLFPSPWFWYEGIDLPDIGYLPTGLVGQLPDFRLNLFVQCKRPEFVSGHRASEWHSWNSPYFRYNLMAHQQQALEKLNEHSAGRAAVVYASPAFWQTSELFHKRASREVVTGSNIAQAAAMTGHDRFTYVASGSFGIAHSEPEQIQGPTVEELIDKGRENERLRWDAHVEKTAIAIRKSLTEGTESAQLLDVMIDVIYREFSRIFVRRGAILKDLATIEAFCDIFGLKIFSA